MKVLLAMEIRFKPELSVGDVAGATFLEAQALIGGPREPFV